MPRTSLAAPVGAVPPAAALLPIGGAEEQGTARTALDMGKGADAGGPGLSLPPTFADALKHHLDRGEDSAQAEGASASGAKTQDDGGTDAATLPFLPPEMNAALARLHGSGPAEGALPDTAQAGAAARPVAAAASTEIFAAAGKAATLPEAPSRQARATLAQGAAGREPSPTPPTPSGLAPSPRAPSQFSLPDARAALPDATGKDSATPAGGIVQPEAGRLPAAPRQQAPAPGGAGALAATDASGTTAAAPLPPANAERNTAPDAAAIAAAAGTTAGTTAALPAGPAAALPPAGPATAPPAGLRTTLPPQAAGGTPHDMAGLRETRAQPAAQETASPPPSPQETALRPAAPLATSPLAAGLLPPAGASAPQSPASPVTASAAPAQAQTAGTASAAAPVQAAASPLPPAPQIPVQAAVQMAVQMPVTPIPPAVVQATAAQTVAHQSAPGAQAAEAPASGLPAPAYAESANTHQAAAPALTTLAMPVAERPATSGAQADGPTPSSASPDAGAQPPAAPQAGFAQALATVATHVAPRPEQPPVHMQTPFGAPGWQNELGNNLVWAAGHEQQKAELVLTPPHLGRIEISITVSNDQASASFVSANAAVRDALEQALPRLREMFANAGITLGDTSVGAESSAGGERNPSGKPGRRSGRLETLATASAGAPAGRAPGLVDTFA